MKYKIYGTEYCPFCKMVKELLDHKKIEYDYLTFEPHSDTLQELKDWTKWKTVPLVFEVDEKGTERFIGGFTDLEKKVTE